LNTTTKEDAVTDTRRGNPARSAGTSPALTSKSETGTNHRRQIKWHGELSAKQQMRTTKH
jgi:hypothetical protein